MTDAVASRGKAPLDVEMGASDAAGAAFQAPFIGHADMVFLQLVHVCRTKIKTGLVGTAVPAHRAVPNPQGGILVHAETVQEPLVLHLFLHLTLSPPSQKTRRSRPREICRRRRSQRSFCFFFL